MPIVLVGTAVTKANIIFYKRTLVVAIHPLTCRITTVQNPEMIAIFT
jgi:hypothetical protein